MERGFWYDGAWNVHNACCKTPVVQFSFKKSKNVWRMVWKNISLNTSTHYLWLLGLCMIFIEVFSCLFVSLKFSAWNVGLCKHKWWKDLYHVYIHIYIHVYIHMHTYAYTFYVYRCSMQKIWEIKNTHTYTHIFTYLNAHKHMRVGL